ncbi:MAG: zinc ribbon domain-containing protein [Gemmatimonadaceae bacterium]|nr:zinc ribbon domain-containing protein [Gemmatimonadaceae bacterium]
MIPLLVGAVLAALGLAFVLTPLLRPATEEQGESVTSAAMLPVEASALEALREVEFDQATGKLSPEDYAALKATYTPLALAELKAREAADAGAAAIAGAADPAEALIARVRAQGQSCPAHGPRPEPDALFCSDCGRYLGAACTHCGAPVESDTARFCVGCGSSLAA